MSEKPLLWHSVNPTATKPRRFAHHYVRFGALAVGLVCVLIGAADVATRISEGTFGTDAAFIAFAPAAALDNSALLASSTKSGALIPAVLTIPSIGVKAHVEFVGKKTDGSMGTPQNFMDVAWYSLGAKLGEPGSVVFDGHVNNALTQAGAFADLSKVEQGAYISIADAQGKTRVYRVSEINLLDPEADTTSLFATTGPEQVVLITCDGEWLKDEHQFSKRLVVVAKPAY